MKTRKNHSWLGALLGLLAVCVVVPRAVAQEVRALIQPSVISVDQAATYSLVFNDLSDVPDFDPEMPEGVHIVGKSRSMQASFGTGGFSKQVILSYLVQAEKEGKYTIPAQSLDLPGGGKLRSTPVQFEVRAGAQLGDYQPIMNLNLGKTECYVGESVPMEIQVLLHPHIREQQISPVEIARDNFTVRQIPPGFMDSTEEFGGQTYHGLTAYSAFTPMKAGRQTIGPASVRFALDIQSAPSPRSAMMFPSRRSIVELKSPVIDVNVKPLPEQGKPAGFTGAVGDFSLYVRSDTKEVRTGEPVTLTCVIRGKGNFEQLKMPAFPDEKGWKVYPAKRGEVPQDDFGRPPTTARWEQVVIPRDNHATIPSFEFSFFDPDKEEYRVVRTEPIPITVTGEPMKADPVAAASRAPDDPKAGDEKAKEEPETPREMLGPVTSLSSVSPAGAVPLWKQPLFWLIQAAVLLLVLGAWWSTVRARRLAAAEADLFTPVRKELDAAKSDSDFLKAAARWVFLRHPAARPDDPALPEFARDILTQYETTGFRAAPAEAGTIGAAKRKEIAAQLRTWTKK